MTPNFYDTGSQYAFEPLTIFDQFIITSDNNIPLQTLYKTISTFKGPRNRNDFIREFEKSGKPYSAARDVYNAVTRAPESILFRSDNETIALATSPSFAPGSTIVHVDYNTFWTQPEFLMIPAVRNLTGKSLDSIIATNAKGLLLPREGIYGPRTRNIFKAIGWSLPESPTNTLLKISREYTNSAAIATRSLVYMIFL